jgi:hypothetical protein
MDKKAVRCLVCGVPRTEEAASAIGTGEPLLHFSSSTKTPA